MGKKLRDSLVLWVIMFGERDVTWEYMYHESGAYDILREAYCSHYTVHTEKTEDKFQKRITPKGLEFIKNG